jgi:hypothetical protein
MILCKLKHNKLVLNTITVIEYSFFSVFIPVNKFYKLKKKNNVYMIRSINFQPSIFRSDPKTKTKIALSQ